MFLIPSSFEVLSGSFLFYECVFSCVFAFLLIGVAGKNERKLCSNSKHWSAAENDKNLVNFSILESRFVMFIYRWYTLKGNTLISTLIRVILCLHIGVGRGGAEGGGADRPPPPNNLRGGCQHTPPPQ